MPLSRLLITVRGAFDTLVSLGTQDQLSAVQRLNVIITNSFSLVCVISAFLLFVSCLLLGKHHVLIWLLPGLCVAFSVPVYLNYKGHFNASRVVLTIFPSVVILAYSVISKLMVSDITFNDFYNFRIALSILCILPLWIFSTREVFLLASTFAFNFMCVSMTDLIHDYFNVGYYDLGFVDRGYDFLNVTTIICTVILSYGIFSMKRRMEDSEVRNIDLVDRLKISLDKIQFQNEALRDHANELREKQLELNEANVGIQKTKTKLEEEIAIYDHEITQFSYNVCHHLRGPIASIAGLVNVLEGPRLSPAALGELTAHFKQTTSKLESVVADLNVILGVRKDIFRLRTMVSLNDMITDAMKLLDREMERANGMVYVSSENIDAIFTSRAFVVNILYNLLSNSLKFRSEERELQIQIRCWADGDFAKIRISDNGIGFEADRFSSQVFQMYQRFHEHVEGKGLGLYLVKLQTTALGGTININSIPQVGTTCCLMIPQRSIRLIDLNNN